MINSSILPRAELSLPQPILQTNSGAFQAEFNRSSFQFTHNLAGHPLFDLGRLAQLSDFLSRTEGNVRCQVSNALTGSKWSSISLKSQVIEAINNIEVSGSWILLYSVQHDPQYAALLEQTIIELEHATGQPLRQEITWLDAYIFIASPQAITPYHIDHESTFLFQIHGSRIANIFDGSDPSILTDQEIEEYYVGNLEAASFSEAKQAKANIYHLVSGTGVHQPVRAPHWFHNGNQYSVALGVHFCSKKFDRQAKIYQFNHYLRKLKIRPLAPGQSHWQDSFKASFISMLSKRHPTSKGELLRSGVHRLNHLFLHKKLGKSPQKLNAAIKNGFRRMIFSNSLLAGLYHYYWVFPRSVNSFRGVYPSFSAAIDAIPLGFRQGYNGKLKINQVDIDLEIATVQQLDPDDKALLPWLQEALLTSKSVFDLGGNTGKAYHSYRQYLNYPSSLSWTVYDLPWAVELGDRLIRQLHSPGLSFTTDLTEAEGKEIFLTSGALQYLESSLAEIIDNLQTKPTHVIVNRVPFHRNQEYITIQNLIESYVPYKIQDKERFVREMARLGYRLIDSWEKYRTIDIPFYPELFVATYQGFYFYR